MRVPSRQAAAGAGRRFSLAVFLLGLSSATSFGQDAPVVRAEQGTYVLRLPETMKAALRVYDPEFRPYRQEDYLPSIRKSYSFSLRRTLFSVIGDFNGDSVLDVALEGHSRARDLLLVILSEGRHFRVLEIRRSPYLDPEKDWYQMGQDKSGRDIVETGRWVYLERRAPGKIKGMEPRPLVLQNEAFEEVAFEKASTLFYYHRGRFQVYVTSD